METRYCFNLVGLVVTVALLGCDSEEIRVYTAPKDPPRQEIDFAALADSIAADGREGGQATWTVPAGWIAEDAPPPLLAAWAVGPSASVRITVSRLTGQGGGALPNINRWRDQLGLEPVARLEDQPMIPLDIAGNPAALVDLPAEEARTTAVLYPRMDQNATWFLKMTGPPSEVQEQLDAFTAFALSVRFESDGENQNAKTPRGQDARNGSSSTDGQDEQDQK